MPSRLKVGLIVDNQIVSKQIDHLVQMSLKSDLYDITCIILQDTDRFSGNLVSKLLLYIRKNGFNKFIRKATFKILVKIEILVVKRNKGIFKTFFDKFDLDSYGIKFLVVKPNLSSKGLVYRYTEEDLKKIESLNLDLLIKGGGGILRGRILETCHKGIIAFHHADNDVNRGGPPGFWEVYNKEKRTGFIIQLLKDELDGGDVIFRGFIATSFLYTLNYVNLLTKSNVFLHKAIESLAEENSQPRILLNKPYAHPLYTTPTLTQQLLYVISTVRTLSYKLYQKLMARKNRWGVAYQFSENWDEVTLWRSKRIKNPPNRYLADPFIWHRDGSHYCFVEDYNFKTSLGFISVYEITKDNYKELGIVLKEPFHLSYPFLLESNGELYMCPETSQSKSIRLYKCIDFPLKWTLAKILMKDVSAADTNIFYRDEKWWLFTNICSSELGDHNSELHIFSSNELLSDTWKPHPKNPVIFDSLSARNGGMLFKQGNAFRVFQRSGWNVYGEAFGVSKITDLTDSTYDEEVQFVVEPKFFKGIKGAHTFSFKNGLIAFDFVESVNNNK